MGKYNSNKKQSESRCDSKSKKKSAAKKQKLIEKISWDLGENRSVRIIEFKGNWFVEIREFFEARSGDMKPGRRGLVLTVEEWQKLKCSADDIEAAIKRNVYKQNV